MVYILWSITTYIEAKIIKKGRKMSRLVLLKTKEIEFVVDFRAILTPYH